MLMKARLLAALGLTAVGALAAGIAALTKKTVEVPAPKAENLPAVPLSVGVYSFISGFQDSATVELSLRFDPETTGFSVVSEDYLCYSSASHVALIESEEFSAQIEYAPYYAGEDFLALQRSLSEKYPEVSPVSFGALSGVKVREGDGECLYLPIPEDKHSYLLVTLFKVKSDDKDPVEALPDKPAVRALLESAELRVQH